MMRDFDYGRREGKMIRHKTHQMERHSRMLRNIVRDNDNLPDWINKKVVLASDYLNSAAQYMANRVSSGDYRVKQNTKTQKKRSKTRKRRNTKTNKHGRK